ncbi:hypothetical protein [Ferrovibrio sp.]|uniref:hypothetical protein n=1 Tax=Ferrovibrio sp. TaxID=1917215 RepID=UPI0035B4A16F
MTDALKPNEKAIPVKDIVFDFNHCGTHYTLHYHGRAMPVDQISYHRPGVICITAGGLLPVLFLENGTYSGGGAIWLERQEPRHD